MSKQEKNENSSRKDELQKTIQELEKEVNKERYNYKLSLAIGFFIIVILIFEIIRINDSKLLLNSNFSKFKVAFYLAMLTLVIESTQTKKFEIKQYRNRIEDIKEEIELINISIQSTEARAEKQFKIHQKGLTRYYDENIRQMKGVFNLGVAAILSGTLLILFTFSTCIKNPEITENTIIPIMGVVGGLACDFIGAIFINMYTKTINASNKFHNKLVYSNNLHFANFLLSKINDENEREKATAEIAVLISKNNINDLDTNIEAEETI